MVLSVMLQVNFQILYYSQKTDSDKIRVTIDYRALNAKTKNDAFASPRTDDLLNKIHRATVFSKIEVHSADHNIFIAPQDGYTTVFCL